MKQVLERDTHSVCLTLLGAIAGVAVCLLTSGIYWLLANHVEITIQTENQRIIARDLARQGNDDAEQYQTVLRF